MNSPVVPVDPVVHAYEVNAALAHLDHHQFPWWQPSKGQAYVGGKRRWLRLKATELLLEGFEVGKTRGQAVRYARWELLKEYKLDPATWLLIIRMVIAIAPILWQWWKSRNQPMGHA